MNKAVVEASENAGNWKKTVFSALVGAAIGAGSVALVIWLAGANFLGAMGSSRVALAGVGLIYFIVSGFLLFGVAVPGVGAKVLNVADAEELVEERGDLVLSGLTMAAFGIVLILLALASAPDFALGPISPAVAGAALLLLIALGGYASWYWRDRFDELNNQLGLEGAAWAFVLSWLVLTLWAAADFLGYGARLTPLDVVSVVSAMLLLGSFVAIGLRGMMVR